MGIYIQYIYITKIVVLVSEPVRGRSRATELPCFFLRYIRGHIRDGGVPNSVFNKKICAYS